MHWIYLEHEHAWVNMTQVVKVTITEDNVYLISDRYVGYVAVANHPDDKAKILAWLEGLGQ